MRGDEVFDGVFKTYRPDFWVAPCAAMDVD